MAAAATGAGLLRMRGPAHSGRVVETCVRSRSPRMRGPALYGAMVETSVGSTRAASWSCGRPLVGSMAGWRSQDWSSQDWRKLLEQPGLEGTGWAGQAAGWQTPGLWADSQAATDSPVD